MKTFISLAVLLCGLSVHAQIPGYTQVPEEKMADYKRAVATALQYNQSAANACDPNWTNQAFNMTSEIFVKNGNAQPLLIFNSYFGPADQEMHRLVFFTSPDLKSVTKVLAEVYEFMQTNTGDLANPVFTNDYVLKGQWDCSRQH
jgi:hypothetical protein